MSEKQKNAKKPRAHKESGHVHGGGGKVKLTELQKILMGKGNGRKLRAQPGYQGKRTYGNGISIPRD